MFSKKEEEKEKKHRDLYWDKMHSMTPGLNQCQVHMYLDMSVQSLNPPYLSTYADVLRFSVGPRGHKVHFYLIHIPMLVEIQRVYELTGRLVDGRHGL